MRVFDFPPSDLMRPRYCRSADSRMRMQNALLFPLRAIFRHAIFFCAVAAPEARKTMCAGKTMCAEVTGSNPVEALIFFRLLLSNCLNWKIYCDDHSSLSSTTAVQIWIISYTSHHKDNILPLLWLATDPSSYIYYSKKLQNCFTPKRGLASDKNKRKGIKKGIKKAGPLYDD